MMSSQGAGNNRSSQRSQASNDTANKPVALAAPWSDFLNQVSQDPKDDEKKKEVGKTDKDNQASSSAKKSSSSLSSCSSKYILPIESNTPSQPGYPVQTGTLDTSIPG